MKKFRKFRQEQFEVKQKKNTGKYISIFLGVLMVLSVFGVFFWNPSQESDYVFGKYDFKSADGKWITKINKKETEFYFLPSQVLHLESKPATQLIKNSQGMIITYDSEINETSRLQAIDVFKLDFVDTLSKVYSNKKIGFATTNSLNVSNLPLITCENASYFFPVLFIDFSNETKINTNNNCIVVSASDEYGVISLLDALRYGIYGVFDEKE